MLVRWRYILNFKPRPVQTLKTKWDELAVVSVSNNCSQQQTFLHKLRINAIVSAKHLWQCCCKTLHYPQSFQLLQNWSYPYVGIMFCCVNFKTSLIHIFTRWCISRFILHSKNLLFYWTNLSYVSSKLHFEFTADV